jgi:hypothetical protein
MPVRALAAIAALAFAASAAAGPVEDANSAFMRGDYNTGLAHVGTVTTGDWASLEAFAARLGNTLYGEIANDRLALIRPDPNQAVLGPNAASARKSYLRVMADNTCSVALSYYGNQNDTTIRLWSMPNGEPITTLSLPFAAGSIAVSQEYVAINVPPSIRLYNLRTGSFLRAIDRAATVGLFFSQDGKELYAVPQLVAPLRFEGGRLFDVQTGAELSAQTISLPSADFLRTADCPVIKQQPFLK